MNWISIFSLNLAMTGKLAESFLLSFALNSIRTDEALLRVGGNESNSLHVLTGMRKASE